VKDFGLQEGDDLFKAPRVQNALEQMPRAHAIMKIVFSMGKCWIVAGPIRPSGTKCVSLQCSLTATASAICGF